MLDDFADGGVQRTDEGDERPPRAPAHTCHEHREREDEGMNDLVAVRDRRGWAGDLRRVQDDELDHGQADEQGGDDEPSSRSVSHATSTAHCASRPHGSRP